MSKYFNPLPIRFSIPVTLTDEYIEAFQGSLEHTLDSEAKLQCHPDYKKHAKSVTDTRDEVHDCEIRYIYLELYQVEGGFSFTKPFTQG